MVFAAAAGYGVLFEAPPARGRFACVKNLGLGSLDGVNELCGQACNAAKTLDEIEGDPFGAENRDGGTPDLEQHGLRGGSLSILQSWDELECGRALAEDLL